jgi:hypothetical protein
MDEFVLNMAWLVPGPEFDEASRITRWNLLTAKIGISHNKTLEEHKSFCFSS